MSYKVVKFGLKQRKLSKIALFSLACLRGLYVTIVESSETYGKLKSHVQKLFSMICFHLHKVYGATIVESFKTYGKLKGLVQKLFSMICFHLHKVYGGQILTQTAKIEQNCSNFPSLLEGLKCHHRWELRNLWQIKGSCPENLLRDLLSFT